MFAFLPVVEPGLCPPSDSGTVGIDGHDSRNVKTLHINLQFFQRVNDSTARYGLGLKFFLLLAHGGEIDIVPEREVIQEIRYQEILYLACQRQGTAADTKRICHARHLLKEIILVAPTANTFRSDCSVYSGTVYAPRNRSSI